MAEKPQSTSNTHKAKDLFARRPKFKFKRRGKGLIKTVDPGFVVSALEVLAGFIPFLGGPCSIARVLLDHYRVSYGYTDLPVIDLATTEYRRSKPPPGLRSLSGLSSWTSVSRSLAVIQNCECE